MTEHQHRPFLSVDEVYAMRRLVEGGRAEARSYRQIGQSQKANDWDGFCSEVEAVLLRHQNIIRAMHRLGETQP